MKNTTQKELKKNIILTDLDHTLTYAFPRDPMIGIVPWDRYHEESINDHPAHDFIKFISVFFNSKKHELIGITSRPEKFRDLTMKWLSRNEIPLHGLWMRPDNDYRAAGIVKIDLCLQNLGESWKEKVLCLIDDNDKVIECFRGEGITCLQVFNKRGNDDA